jgi:N-acetylglucosaminyldiphosphoundecaprenol N-acetyl-beta-D-mannosaminyltransferase
MEDPYGTRSMRSPTAQPGGEALSTSAMATVVSAPMLAAASSPLHADPASDPASAPALNDARAGLLTSPAAHLTQSAPQHASQPLPIARLMGVEIHAITERQAIEHILRELSKGRGGVTITPNLDHLRRCKSNMEFAAMVAEAELVVADGMPLIWASRIAGCPLPQRVAGSDLILTLSAAAAEHGRSIYLLGGAPGTAEGAAEVLRSRHPNIRIVGTNCPPLGFDQNETEIAKLVENLVEAAPDIVFVALGSPKQERLIERIRTSLPQAWWLGVGVSFSFLTGHVQRAPKVLQQTGLEWVHRLFQEPKRLFKRYVVQGLPFAGQLFASAVAQRVNGWLGTQSESERCYPRPNRSGGPVHAHAGAHKSAHANGHHSGFDLVDIALQERAAREPVSTRGTRDGHGGGALARLKAVVLLSGQLRPSPLMTAVQRNVLDLPVTEDRTLLNHWLSDAGELAKYAGVDGLPVRVLVSQSQDEPVSLHPRYREILSIEKDASEFRGTGGVLSDITREYGDDDFVLVANAAQLLLEPMSALATALDHKRSDIALVSHLDGTPGGVMLIRCATLRSINSVGFIDLKEQALPNIARSFDVRVVHCRRPTGLPLRTTGDYVSALRQWHRGPGRLPGSRRGQIDPLAEDFSRGFSVVENGAWVDSSVYLHDAIVLRGARVEPGVAFLNG